MSLTAVEEKEARLAFKLYDELGAGTLPANTIGKTLRSLGLTPSLYEIRAIQHSLGDSYDSEKLCEIYAQNKQNKPPAEFAMREALAEFDVRKTGELSSAEMKLALTSLGERLSDEEADQILKAADKSGTGKISLDAFAAYLCGDEI